MVCSDAAAAARESTAPRTHGTAPDLTPAVLPAAVKWSSVDVGLLAPSSTPAAAANAAPSDVYGSSLQAGAWLSPKLLVKEQPSLESRGGQGAAVRGTGAHDACSGAIIITGAHLGRLRCRPCNAWPMATQA